MLLLQEDNEKLIVTETNGDKVEKDKEDTLSRFNVSYDELQKLDFKDRYEYLDKKRTQVAKKKVKR